MSLKSKKDNIKDFVYCGHRKCPHTHCLRHHIYEPWNMMIYETKFKVDKEWKCNYILEEK